MLRFFRYMNVILLHIILQQNGAEGTIAIFFCVPETNICWCLDSSALSF